MRHDHTGRGSRHRRPPTQRHDRRRDRRGRPPGRSTPARSTSIRARLRGGWSSSGTSTSATPADRLRPPVRRADLRPPPRRHPAGRATRDLHGRPARFERSTSTPSAARARGGTRTQRLAHRRHARGEPAGGVDPAGRRRPGVRRRHDLDQPRGRLRGAVPTAPGFVDSCAAEHCYGANLAPGPAPSGYLRRLDQNRWSPTTRWSGSIPETGERALFVNPVFTGHIVGVNPDESRWILDRLFASSPGPSTRSGSAGRPAASPSGTTGPPPTSAHRTSTTSTSPGCCTGSR